MTTIAALNANGEQVMVTPLDTDALGRVVRPSVHAALAAVMAELPNIGKGDRSPEGYQYRGIEAVTKHAQPLFAKHGVVISPKATITQVVPSPAMKDGWQDVYAQVEWTITGPDGSTLTAQTNGIGRDRSDKGANKAQTQAYKYLLLHLLCIADGKDDSDGQTYEHDRAEGPRPWNKLEAKKFVLSLAEATEVAAAAWEAFGDSTPWTEADLRVAFDEWVNQDPTEIVSGEASEGDPDGAVDGVESSPDTTPEETDHG